MHSGMTTNQQPAMFELGGLFASVDTIETTPLDLLTLPREIAPGVIQTSSHGEPLTTAAEQACGLPSELSRVLAEDHQARKVHAPEIADRCPSWPACDTRTDKQKLRDAVQAGERAYIEQTETVPMFHGKAAAILDRIDAKVHNTNRVGARCPECGSWYGERSKWVTSGDADRGRACYASACTTKERTGQRTTYPATIDHTAAHLVGECWTCDLCEDPCTIAARTHTGHVLCPSCAHQIPDEYGDRRTPDPQPCDGYDRHPSTIDWDCWRCGNDTRAHTASHLPYRNAPAASIDTMPAAPAVETIDPGALF